MYCTRPGSGGRCLARLPPPAPELSPSGFRRGKEPVNLPQYPSSFQENETAGQLGRGDWSDVILPAIPSELFTQQMSYVIRGLEPGTQYEARVRARNRFGWNELSEKFHFSTRGSGIYSIDCASFRRAT